MQQVLDKYNLIYKAQAEIPKHEDSVIIVDSLRESRLDHHSSRLDTRMSRPLTEEQDRTQWLYW
jgi:hypothetical protein